MKKRLLALALCLVMMTSLLPIIVAAESDYLRISSSGFEKGVDGFVMKAPELECYYTPKGESPMDCSIWLPIFSMVFIMIRIQIPL